MTTYNSSNPAAELSPELLGKISSTWGSVAGMTAALKRAADSVFGSGWAWLVVRDNLQLAIVTTPNQDNPLMTSFVPAETRGWPLLGIDVWEHSYYLKWVLHWGAMMAVVQGWAWACLDPASFGAGADANHECVSYLGALQGPVVCGWDGALCI